MNIIQALDDPAVFAALYPDKQSWTAWRSFLCALFALPMDGDALRIYQECTGRIEPPAEAVQEAWLPIGRKGGKSRTLALTATYLAAFVDWRPYLSVGERGVIMVVAQDRAAAQVLMNYVSGNFHACPMLEQLVERESDDRIDLTNRISIRVFTCSIRSVRGPTVIACLADEIAFWRDENSANPDEEVIASVRPAMSTIGGGLLLAASSPYARKGALWRAYQKHYGKEGDPVLIWKAPTRVMNPCIAPSVIDSALERDPARYTAEYMAEFRTDIESFVALEVVQACVDAGVYERAPSNRFRYVGFVDPSGGSGSSFALAIAHVENGKAVLDCVREVRAPFDPSVVVWQYADLLKQYGIKKISGDHYAGEWPREAFRKLGVSYEPCKDPKSLLYVNLLPLLNSGTVRLLDDARLTTQLVNLERQTGRSGRDSIAAADNGNDDVANAVAGAALLAIAKRPTMWVGVGLGHVSYRPELNGGRVPPHQELRVRYVTVHPDGSESSDVRCYERDPKFLIGSR